jgi:hypothetical protein
MVLPLSTKTGISVTLFYGTAANLLDIIVGSDNKNTWSF